MCDQDVSWFDVAVNNAACVGMVKRHTDLPQHLEDLQLGYFSTFKLCNETVEVSMVEYLLDPDFFLRFKPVEAVSDVRMPQTQHDLCLLDKDSLPLFAKGFHVTSDVAAFKGNILFGCLVVRFPDFALAPVTELSGPNKIF